MGPNYNYQAPTARSNAPKLDRKFVLIIGGCILALVIAVALLVGGGSSLGEDLARATGQQTALATLTSENQENIKDSELRLANANASVFFASDVNVLTEKMNEAGQSKLAKGAGALSEEESTKLEESLTTGTFDREYQKMLEQKIDAQQALLRELQGKTDDPEIQTTLKDTYDHLEIIRKQLKA